LDWGDGSHVDVNGASEVISTHAYANGKYTAKLLNINSGNELCNNLFVIAPPATSATTQPATTAQTTTTFKWLLPNAQTQSMPQSGLKIVFYQQGFQSWVKVVSTLPIYIEYPLFSRKILEPTKVNAFGGQTFYVISFAFPNSDFILWADKDGTIRYRAQAAPEGEQIEVFKYTGYLVPGPEDVDQNGVATYTPGQLPALWAQYLLQIGKVKTYTEGVNWANQLMQSSSGTLAIPTG
jgi:hypothetical protein